MANYELWHNPRCSKSREALARLQAAGIEAKVFLYLETPPTKARLQKLLKLLAYQSPRELMRTKEAIYKELELASTDSDEALLEAMVAHPTLIERPVLIRDEQDALVGRPPERLDALL